ncbi:hypothetical protein BGW38_004572 [Lunasporangiospora selenospora]|uniref:SANT domain-containing protein n=1 Tax=Lunasporangiospora selenospora TaxID=979761 RepID=A0A9P6FPJ4_9FUNG|nr:hypothetical protein BGW38_004572 [Lunasporangiospora selenospora]
MSTTRPSNKIKRRRTKHEAKSRVESVTESSVESLVDSEPGSDVEPDQTITTTNTPQNTAVVKKGKSPPKENQPPPLETLLFRSRINGRSKLRRQRLGLANHLERVASTKASDNPFWDTSDSELDEIESEIELENNFVKDQQSKIQDQLKAPKDGTRCASCLKPNTAASGAIDAYEATFDQHQEETRLRAHSTLQVDMGRQERSPLVAGGMSWTPDEADLFYHGLERFGRHNVWAIQEHIKTRSLAEVVTMIQAMETEMAHLKYFGVSTMTLNEMPMADEVDEDELAHEEECANVLLEKSLKAAWEQDKASPLETRPDEVEKTLLFNMQTLADLSSRLYVQNEGAGIDRQVVTILYDALKAWLSGVLQEILILHHERHRTQLLTNKLPLNPGRFLAKLAERNGYLAYKDEYQVLRQPGMSVGRLPMGYYMNESVDRKQAEAPDSDQDQDSDDGVSDEEEAELTLEAPLPILSLNRSDRDTAKEARLSNFIQQQQNAEALWRQFWTESRSKVNAANLEVSKETTEPVVPAKRRFRETNPLIQQALPFETWKEGVERLAANTFALPISEEKEVVRVNADTPVYSMNKRARTHQQRTYLEDPKLEETITKFDMARRKRLMKYEYTLYCKAARITEKRLLENYAPGYGMLPKQASLLFDPLHPPPKNGYGLGERQQGGLWFQDRKPLDLLSGYLPTTAQPQSIPLNLERGLDESVNYSGYFTVSDTEDEEEEEEGANRQIEADKENMSDEEEEEEEEEMEEEEEEDEVEEEEEEDDEDEE